MTMQVSPLYLTLENSYLILVKCTLNCYASSNFLKFPAHD
jgi:hypothetical protein